MLCKDVGMKLQKIRVFAMSNDCDLQIKSHEKLTKHFSKVRLQFLSARSQVWSPLASGELK